MPSMQKLLMLPATDSLAGDLQSEARHEYVDGAAYTTVSVSEIGQELFWLSD